MTKKRKNLKLATDDGVPINSEGIASTGLQPPVELDSPLEEQLWRDHIQKAPWIIKLDLFTALMWTRLQAEFIEHPEKFNASRLAQLQKIATSLGLTPASRKVLKARWRDWVEDEEEESPLDQY